MFQDVAGLHAAIMERDPTSFVSHHIFAPVPFAFNGNLTAWLEWKQLLGEALDVDPQDIVMTGSAAVGFSLNPHKDFKAFHDGSDIDCGVISSHYFDVAWRYLRQQRVSWLSLPQITRNAIVSHQKSHVFAGTIAADKMLGILPFGKSWLSGLEKMSGIDPTKGRSVKLRLYKDYDSLRYYQSHGVNQLREQLAGAVDTGSTDIETVDDIAVEGEE